MATTRTRQKEDFAKIVEMEEMSIGNGRNDEIRKELRNERSAIRGAYQIHGGNGVIVRDTTSQFFKARQSVYEVDSLSLPARVKVLPECEAPLRCAFPQAAVLAVYRGTRDGT